jgi:uncharacterized protein YerC
LPDTPGRSTPITLRAQAFALLEEGVPIARITEATGLSKSTIYRIKQIAYERGYDPKVSREFKDEYFRRTLQWKAESYHGRKFI